ncbi:Phage tail fiber protein [[Actinomadura] parvosata subsp. kistnae]|uniref:N-acetylmuramoyl-L-alanine amidase n=1 Tax=[Actinomadura] parvosata subsp. kistnae TaxID=1909395 RepID=A0A1V0ABQ2_9ACTN|nr:peptidoglycan recognition family protein [Nonomuraea sp. ATCC 55076]AQZ67648.1 hypothetical protein BKM31_44825 [Nonomuraea sp. ATCC 55076]SPL94065.1 Phage tail fiber protein [Actinomadura parvosata subsp. kistnae]
MNILSRAAWDARAPKSQNTVSWATRTEFFVHHTDGPTTQTVRSIQDFHMGPSRGWSDVGYNFLVRDDGTIYQGRGWLVVGAHCPDHNRTGIGVAYIGRNNPTDAAKKSIRWLYDEACRRAGRKLKKLGHGDRYPTECPGPALHAWVKAGMPVDHAETDDSWTETLVKQLPLLKPGDDNWDVKTARGLLMQRGYLPEAVYATVGLKGWLDRTVYDPELVGLIKGFQRIKKLDDDGLCGPLTWTALLRLS